MLNFYFGILFLVASVGLNAMRRDEISKADIDFIKLAIREQITENSTLQGAQKYFSRFIGINNFMSESDNDLETNNDDDSDESSNEMKTVLAQVPHGKGSAIAERRLLYWFISLNKIYNPKLEDKSDKNSLAKAIGIESLMWMPLEQHGKCIKKTLDSTTWTIDEKNTILGLTAVVGHVVGEDYYTRLQVLKEDEMLFCTFNENGIEHVEIVDHSCL